MMNPIKPNPKNLG